MTPGQRIKQQQACHIQFKTLRSQGIVPDSMTVYDYALQVLGVKVDSLKLLSDPQLNALRDRLMGKPNRLAQTLEETARAVGIDDLAGWMKHKAELPGWSYLSGHTPETLPANLQHRLVRCLEAWKQHNSARERVKSLQPTLF